jgi:PPP family 3-phenylpropionic acid transporter
MDSIPYKRLSAFYFFYFALLGAIIPYWSLYLESMAFDAMTIGVLMSISHVTRVFAPSLWGYLADRTGYRLKIIRYGAAATWLVFLLMFDQDSAWRVGVVMLLFSFFWNAVLPQFEVVTMSHLGDLRSRYSQVRVWGSIGFIVIVVGFGYLFDALDIGYLVHAMWLIMIMIWVCACSVPSPVPDEPNSKEEGQPVSFWSVFFTPAVLAFFVATFLVQFSHGPYYTFFSIMMESTGFSRGQIGWIWAIGVIAEVGAFIVMHRFIQAMGCRTLMIISLLLAALRWVLVALFPSVMPVILLSQLLHAASFGAMHATGITLVHRFFISKHQGKGQALFSSLGFGLGGSLGALVSGYVWAPFGPELTFLLAACACLLAAIVTFIWMRDPYHAP